MIGSYELRGLIGDGSFSTVKLAYNTRLEEYFACKIFPKSSFRDDPGMAQFEQEVRIHQQLQHPHVVSITDLLQDSQNFYLFSEYCSNGELLEYILAREYLSEDEARTIFAELIVGLNYIHSKNVSHRDIKPENLLLDAIGRLKIADFGLSKFVDSNNMVQTSCGSLSYASPECLSGNQYNGFSTDIWSAGVVLFTLISGKLPWSSCEPRAMRNQICSANISYPQYLSTELADLFQRIFCVDTTQRITGEEILQHSWLNGIQIPESIQPIHRYLSTKSIDLAFNRESTLGQYSIVPRTSSSSTLLQPIRPLIKSNRVKTRQPPRSNINRLPLKRFWCSSSRAIAA